MGVCSSRARTWLHRKKEIKSAHSEVTLLYFPYKSKKSGGVWCLSALELAEPTHIVIAGTSCRNTFSQALQLLRQLVPGGCLQRGSHCVVVLSTTAT